MKQKKIYIGGKAGNTDFISQRRQLGAPGPIAGIGGETTKCLWCGKLFDGIMASCGTGTTWSLYRCPHCKKLTAEGSIIPNVVKTDPKIKIMNGSENVALGKTALSGSPERDACHSFLGEKEKAICPICGKEGKRSGGFSETVSTQYGDVETEGWECSNGHHWRRRWEMISKIFKITECGSDCPLRQTPAYDSQWCNFYGKDLDYFRCTKKYKKPNFCKVKKVVVEEASSG